MKLGTKKTVIEVDYSELDELITKEYGREYECVAYEEWGNYESHGFDVQKEELDEYSKNSIEAWKRGDKKAGRYMTATFMKDMCNRGIIEPGEYLINIFW